MGGLHVIATERHEAGRIDRQLFGRCARQGDPGTCQAYVSLEDELATVYVRKPFRLVAQSLLGEKSRRIGRLAGKGLMTKAQWAAEQLHSRTRHQLLKMDEQMGTALAFSGRPE